MLSEKDAEIQRLQEVLPHLSTIKVSFDGELLSVTDLPRVLHLDTLNAHAQVATLEVQADANTLDDHNGTAVADPITVDAQATRGTVQKPPLLDLLKSEQA